MNVESVVLAALIGYLWGCIQTAFIMGRLVRGIDIRQHGTTNAGASNATIVLGWKYGIVTGLCDVLKGTAAVLVVRALFPAGDSLAFVAGVFAVLGHIFPVFLKFRGGKGVATLVGVLLGLEPWLGLLTMLFLLVSTVLSDYVAVGSIVLYLVLPFIAVFVLRLPLLSILLASGLMALGVYKHSPNVRKIVNKQEVGLRATLRS